MLRAVKVNDEYKRTYWDIAAADWNDNNSGVELDINIEQPDYSKLNG